MKQFLFLAAFAAARAWSAETKAPAPTARETNYKISFTMKVDELEHAGRFILAGGSQGSYHWSSETSLTTQCLAVAVPKEENIRAECQFELTGTSKGKPVGFRYQGTFVVRRASPLALVDEPTRRLEVMFEEVKLPK